MVTEVWNNELAKWVVLDGQNKATWELGGQPQSAIELRDLRSQGLSAQLTMKHRGSTWMAWLVYFHTLNFPVDNAIFDHRGRSSVTLVPSNHLPELLFQGTPTSEPQLADAARAAPELNRAHADISVVPSKAGLSRTLSVRLTNSCPWPCQYVATINGHSEEVTANRLTWALQAGPNVLAHEERAFTTGASDEHRTGVLSAG